jgi:hypothetical protein
MRTVTSARPGWVLFAPLIAALAIGFGASRALAATTWTIKPGGSITGSAGATTLKDEKTGTKFTCGSAALDGQLKSGSGLQGTGIGSFSSGSFSRCTSPLGLILTLKLLDLPWHIDVTSYANGLVTGTISHIEISVTTSGCKLVIDGTAGGVSDGVLDFTYSNSTHKLKTSGGNLHTYNVMGCFGLFTNGDPFSIPASYAISPPQRITSP